MNKHTPGPWKLKKKEHKFSRPANEIRPEKYSSAHIETWITTDWYPQDLLKKLEIEGIPMGEPPPEWPIVCIANGLGGDKDGDDSIRFIKIKDEDAKLIAAAPELFAVLKELQESASYWSEYDVPLGIVDRINQAIAKAES